MVNFSTQSSRVHFLHKNNNLFLKTVYIVHFFKFYLFFYFKTIKKVF